MSLSQVSKATSRFSGRDFSLAATFGAPAQVTEQMPTISVVVPIMNAMRFLPDTLPTIIAAGKKVGGIELIYVDNGSTDGSREFLLEHAPVGVQVYLRKNASIAALRNFGAQQASSSYLSFIDADCLIPEGYFEEALSALASSGAAATGCEIHVPARPHWIESAWHDLHYIGRSRFVPYLNSGNFFVSASAFRSVGGFSEQMRTGEDAEIGRRLVSAGFRIFACPAVQAVHLGNPKSIREFYRRNVWHGLGMFGTVSWTKLDRPTAMLALHLLATALGVALLLSGPIPLMSRVLAALALQLAVPVATVIYRGSHTQRWKSIGTGVPLYWLYYWARAHALLRVASGSSNSYSK